MSPGLISVLMYKPSPHHPIHIAVQPLPMRVSFVISATPSYNRALHRFVKGINDCHLIGETQTKITESGS